MEESVEFELVSPGWAHQAFGMAVELELEMIGFDTLLKSYEEFSGAPPWLSVVRGYFDRCLERQQALEVFLSRSQHE